MSEIEYAIADTQRFTGRVYIAQPNHQVRDWPVRRHLERDNRRAEDLDRGFERWRLEDERARVVFPLIAGLIVSTTEGDPASRTLTDRLRRAHCTSGQMCRLVS